MLDPSVSNENVYVCSNFSIVMSFTFEAQVELEVFKKSIFEVILSNFYENATNRIEESIKINTRVSNSKHYGEKVKVRNLTV